MSVKNKLFIVIGIWFALAGDALAQKYTWSCKFPSFEDRLSYVYDSESQKGFLIGNVGTADLEVHLGQDAITFIELLITGIVQTTTIILKTSDAIHSRHTVMENSFVPSQVSGKCKRLI